MFGHVDFVVKAAPGTGIVSSAVLQSDDLDEIDWEWLGGDDQQVQTNYFGKGQTTTYNRGTFAAAAGNHDGFHKYSIDWTADQISWQVDGTTVRSLTQAEAQGQYPQTPMMVKVGAWSGGDPSNPPGTVQWAGGPTNYAAGPFAMEVKSIAVTDYSTGSQYKYTGTDGTWQSITAVGGTVHSSGTPGSAAEAAAAPSVTASSNGPMPFQGTHSDKGASSAVQPNAGGWSPTTMQTSAAASATTYPGLPAGWTVSSSGKVIPPSAAPVSKPPIPLIISRNRVLIVELQVTSPAASSTSSPSASQPDISQAQGGQSEVTTTYDQQGFPVVVTQQPGAGNAPKSYDDRGFLITAGPALESRSAPTAIANNAANAADSGTMSATPSVEVAAESASPSVAKVSPSATGAGARVEGLGMMFVAVSGILGGVLLF